jgi:hypothetical protein
MGKVGYFRQMRQDGAIRTGITVNGNLVLHLFENEAEEPDPALLWYVDVRSEGKSLPTTAEEARSWLLNQSAVIRSALNDLANDLQAGMDIDVWPLQRRITGTPRGLRMTIVCSVVRRLEGLRIAEILRVVAEGWVESIHAAKPLEALQL